MLILILVLLLLFGGGGFYLGGDRGPVWGGSGVGLVLLIILILYVTGNLHIPR